MATLNAYFDESGKLADTTCVAFGGLMGHPNDMSALSRRWQGLLKDQQLKYVRMTEAINFRGEFYGWQKRRDERDALLMALAECVMNYGVSLVCGVTEAEKFNQLPDVRKRELHSPEYVGFEACIRELVSVIAGRQQQHLLHLFCDSSEQYAAKCLGLYHRLRARNREIAERCIAITFGEDEHFPPIQAADMYAFCRRRNEAEEVPEIIKELIRLFDERGSKGLFGYRHGRTLGDGEIIA